MLRNYFDAVIGSGGVDRAVEILRSRVSRATGLPVYATAVVDHIVKDDGGDRYGVFMMVGDARRAFRLNWRTADTSAEIVGVDFWVAPSAHPQYSANTENLNMVEIVRLIDDVIHGGRVPGETTEAVTEAVSQATFKDVAAFFESKGYSIAKDPAFTVRRYIVTHIKSGTETPIRYIPVMDQMYEELTGMGAEKFIAKYAADPGTKVVPASGERPAERESTQFDDLFEKPLTEEEVFGLLDQGIADVKSGRSKTLLITGTPGIGKTFTVAKQLAGADSESFKGGITSAAALYRLLFINNAKGKILIFDDLDTLFEDKECVNILKGALESSNEAEVSYISSNNVHPTYYRVLTGELDKDDPEVVRILKSLKIDLINMNEKRLENLMQRAHDPYSPAAVLPNKFRFQSRVIFISNKYLDEIPGALVSRGGTKIEINLTLDEIVKRIERLLPELEVPVEPGTPPITMREKKAALDYCKNILVPYGRIPRIDFRGFHDLCRLASGDTPPAIWHRWASVSLKETYGEKDSSFKRKKR